MATTIAISCPKCEKLIKAPASVAGKKIRCKDCHHVFLVEAPEAKAEPAPDVKAKAPQAAKAGGIAKVAEKKHDDTVLDDIPYQVNDMDFLPRCPYCAKELESEDQVVCLNCGYNLRTRERIKAQRTYDLTGLDFFVWLLPGIACTLGLLAMIGSIVVFWTVFPNWEKDGADGWGWFLYGLHARIWLSVIFAFIGFFFAKYAIKRLIFNFRPPERERFK